MKPRLVLAIALVLAPLASHADVDSLVTVGVGAQYGFVTDGVARDPEAPERQYGLVGRLKVLRFLGLEVATQLDENPHTQRERVLSPRYQLGVMLNLIPTRWFNLYAVGGLGAHRAGDLLNLDGVTTSIHAGPGVELFFGEHLTIGVDVRFRAPGPNHIKAEVIDELSAAPVDDAVALSVWQANVMVGWYL